MASFEELERILKIVKGAKVATKYGTGKLLYVDKSKAGVVLDPGVSYDIKLSPFMEIEVESSGQMIMFDHKELEVL